MQRVLLLKLVVVLTVLSVTLSVAYLAHTQHLSRRILHTSYYNSDNSSTSDTTTTLLVDVNSTSCSIVQRDDVIQVAAAGGDVTLLQRVQCLNSILDSARHTALSDTTTSDTPTRRRVYITDDDYLTALRSLPHVTTILLPWQHASGAGAGRSRALKESLANSVVEKYYRLTGSGAFCHWLKTKAHYRLLTRLVYRDVHCSHQPALHSTSLPQLGHYKANNGHWFAGDFHSSPPVGLTHVHVLRGGVVVRADSHITAPGLQLVFNYCHRNGAGSNALNDVPRHAPHYTELFAMRHSPGHEVYHGLAEELPRIAPFLEFLTRNPQIKIHTSDAQRLQDWLRLVGIDSARIVTDRVVMATVAYVPRAPSCMMPRLVEIQLLAAAIRRHNDVTTSRNTVLLITRSTSRQFVSASDVISTVQSAAVQSGFQYSVYPDNLVPPLNVTLQLFQSAVLVVASLGAGLSNIIFCQPGTVVIEVVPTDLGSPLCYLQLAHVLGLRWHAIPGHRESGRKLSLNIGTLAEVLRYYLTRLQQQQQHL